MNISALNLVSFEYQTEDILLLPLSREKRSLFPANFWYRIHERLIQDGTLKTVFAGMQDCKDVVAWTSFIERQTVVLYIVKPDTVVGFGWIAESMGVPGAKKGAFGFLFFKGAWAKKSTRDLCWLSLQWWFKELDHNILYATSVITNHLAINFSRNFRFEYLCRLPMFFLQDGILVDAHLICLKREDFAPQFEEWRDKNPIVHPIVVGIES